MVNDLPESQFSRKAMAHSEWVWSGGGREAPGWGGPRALVRLLPRVSWPGAFLVLAATSCLDEAKLSWSQLKQRAWLSGASPPPFLLPWTMAVAHMNSVPCHLALSFLPSDEAAQPLPGCTTRWSNSQSLGDLVGTPGTITLSTSWGGREAGLGLGSIGKHVAYGCSVDSG